MNNLKIHSASIELREREAMASSSFPADSSLIQRLLLHDVVDGDGDGDDIFLAFLLPWISGTSSTHLQNNGQALKLEEEMQQTNRPSFAKAFLEYVRSESEMFFSQLSESESKENEPHSVINSSNKITSRSEEKHIIVNSPFVIDTPTNNEGDTYDAEFPSLGGFPRLNVVTQKAVTSLTRPKRRVNPTPTQNPVVDSAFVLAKIESNKSGDNNSSKTRSNIPLKVDMDALMQRCDQKRKSKSKTAELAQISMHQSSVHDKCVTMQKKSTGSTQSLSKSSSIPKSTINRLRRFAAIHSKLIFEKLVPTLVGELQYLFQLLSLQRFSKHQYGVRITERHLFESSNDCSFYACTLMEHLGRILDSVGEPLLSSLINHPFLVQYFPALQKRLKASLASHQATTLHSVKLYKACNTTNVLSETADIGLPVSLPFQAARDSRNNYKSRESQTLYNNRELCRDQFYAIIRDAASVQNSFGCTLDESYLKMQESVKLMMNVLLIENYPWFTELFLEQFVQVAMCGETDPVVTGLARQDPMKLQRLHDRLTLGQRNRSSSSSLPFSNPNKVNDSKGVKILNSNAENFKNTVKSEKVNPAGIEFITYLPPSLRIYVWILEAADSYRLTMLMIWNLKSKISRLTEIPQHSRDAAEIGSLLTQRVLSLKALASLLGFLCFFPDGGPQTEGLEWEFSKTDPPINVVEVIEKAISNETMLLTLPWVLDFLRLAKLNQQAVSLLHFQKALKTLWNVYNYPILDPKCEYFGVPSICILASLDRFFEFMDLPTYDVNLKETESGKVQKHAPEDSPHEAKINSGLDRIVGVVDTSYIQHCCPALMELRVMLMEVESQPSGASKSSILHGKSLRKITPVHHPKASGFIDQGVSLVVEDVTPSSDSYIQVKLQQSFFEQRPELQRLVDFVVDTIAVNAARAASLKCVPPILRAALCKLETLLSHKLHITIDNKVESEIEADVENIITSTIQGALIPAMDYAKNYTRERVSEALTVLASPDESPYALGVAARIAADASGSAACKKTLANISCDVRKCITQEVEIWRQGLHNVQKNSDKQKEHEELMTVDVSKALNGNELQDHILMEESENIQSELLCLRSTFAMKNKHDNVLKRVQSGPHLDRTLSYFARVVEFCSDCLQIGKQRHLLRVNLAAACISMETLLSSECSQLPLGGFDALVYTNADSECLGSLDLRNLATTCDDLEVNFRIEIGLVKRSIALALGFCLLSPFQAFGYSPESLDGCMCFLPIVDSQYVDKLEFKEHPFRKFYVHEQGMDGKIFFRRYCEESTQNSFLDEKSLAEKRCVGFRKENHFGHGLMPGLLSMWEMLVRNGILQGDFLISEILSTWRWLRLLQSQPWKTCKNWFEAVTHGIASTLAELICICESSSRFSEKPPSILLECLFKDFFVNQRGSSSQLLCYLRRIVTCISIEVLHLQLEQENLPDKTNHRNQKYCEGSTADCILAVISLVELCSEREVKSFIDVVLRRDVKLPIKQEHLPS